MKKILLLLFVTIFPLISHASSLSGKNIFDIMINKYRNLVEYEDKGVVETSYYRNNKMINKDIQKFNTYFKYPYSFKFEWVDYYDGNEPQFNYINAENDNVTIKLSGGKIKEMGDLNKAISASTGLTGRASYWLPRLFLDNVFCPNMDNLIVETVGEEYLLGRSLIVVDIRYQSGNIERLWINKDDYTLVKISSNDKINGLDIIIEIIYIESHLKSDASKHDHHDRAQ